MNPKHLIVNFLTLIVLGECATNPEIFFNGTCKDSFSCGTIPGFRYPFRGENDPAYCGYPGFELNCNEQNPPTISIKNMTYQIQSIDPTAQILKIVREDMIESNCPQDLVNTTMDYSLFNYTSGYMNMSFLFGCPVSMNGVAISPVLCSNNGGSPVFLMPGEHGPEVCESSVMVPVPIRFMDQNLSGQVVGNGFEVRWKVDDGVCTGCRQSGGQCVYNDGMRLTACGCPEPHILGESCVGVNKTRVGSSSPSRSTGFARKLIIGISSGMAVIMLMLFVILCRKKRLWENRGALKLGTKKNHEIEIFIRNFGSISPKRFKYLEIKIMTNSFVEKLGQGGYGSVYKGQMPDGKLVAVKLLGKAIGDGQDFINEVASIGRTSHVNVVTLLGYCFDGKKKALMYEFMPNGSLDKFLRGDGPHLDWNTLFQIAKGIARGLEYLHQDCNTRIVHFDIKPHNILLDEEFIPKISDFGLAKLSKRKESIVSVTGARGTAGYMAPEVFFKSLGGASHKSDVYSYGMMVLEMTGARKKNKSNTTSMSESYFPDWIYNRVEGRDNLGVDGVTTEEEEELARKMVMVGLWCIQSDPLDRPSISKVVEMLEGSLQSLQVPPKRFWPCPTMPALDTSPSAIQSLSGEIVLTKHAVVGDLSS